MYRLFWALFTVYCLAQAARTSRADNVYSMEFNKCENIDRQDSIEMNQVTKGWYVIGIFYHKLINDYAREIPLELICCPYINISYAHNHSLMDLNLRWEDEKGTIEYRFKINDLLSPGTWTSSGAQNGSLVDRCYKQFVGKVFVRKAVEDHMWLQFCSPNTHLYSVVVATEKWPDPKVVKSIIKIMEIQKIPITLRTQMCGRSSSTARATVWLTVAVTVLCFRLSGMAYKTN